MKKMITLSALLLLAAGACATAADGQAVYDKKCAKCHAKDGSGNTKMGKKLKCRDLTDPAVQAKLTDKAIVDSMKVGVKEGDKTVMKPVKGMTDEEIAAVTKYVRSLKK